MKPYVRVTFAAGLLLSASIAAAEPRWISILPSGNEAILREEGADVWTRQADFIIGTAADAAIERLSRRGVTPLAEIQDQGQSMYLLHHGPGFVPPSAPRASIYQLTPDIALYLFPEGSSVELPGVKPYAAFQGIPRIPLPPRVTHPADLAATPQAPTAFNPLVAQILAATSQPSWYQFVRDLSGDNPVVIGGQTFTITTRYSDAMFPTPRINAHATEYLEDRGAGWGYTSKRESYTAADSGCNGVQTRPWQNLIFVVPGQVDYGQHQQVLFVNHYDTISYSTAESLANAPGADDAISGGSALLEAMRTFKSYGFKNTLVFALFSGEEVGICGSNAYVRQHPAVDMWRVVNMDQTAYDGDLNRRMNVYNWDTTNSPGSVALGDAFVQANGDYGNIIAPDKILRSTSKMCQTDHCPFWDVGVPAIALLEDLIGHDICPCFDSGQSASCHDTVTQIDPNHPGRLMFTQDYSWPTEKAAIALIAQLAEPLYACPAAPVDPPVVTTGNATVDISWTAASGVTNYVVERAATCAGPFTGITSVTGTSFEDINVANGASYAYRVRTCPTQVSACVTATPQTGPSVEYQDGSAVLTADSGDHDAIADNCELLTLELTLINDGNVPLDNVRLASVSSSNPAVRIASALPHVPGSLGVGATATVAFKFYLGREGGSTVCGDPLAFTVTVTSDQSPPSVRSLALTAERSTVGGPLSYGFESDFSGWSTISGSVTRVVGGAVGSTGASLHFRTNLQNDCNGVQSPLIKPSVGSTVTMSVNYVLETGPYDRANLRAVDVSTGAKSLLTPTGATYDAGGEIEVVALLCDGLDRLSGWSGNFPTWRDANFDLSPYAGKEIKLEVRESTNSAPDGSQGFWMDLVNVTNATQITCDVQSDACAALPPEVSPDGDPVPFTIGRSGTDLQLVFSESAGATTYNVYRGSLGSLGQGIYDHAALLPLCGFTDAIPGDGSVVVTILDASVPVDSYMLAVARSGAGESKYGTGVAAAPIPLALNACP